MSYIMGFVLALVIIGGVGLYTYTKLQDLEGLFDYCKKNGYDGIRYEQVNFLREEPLCANFTIEERYEIEKNKEFNEAGEKVFNSFIGKKDPIGVEKE